MTDYSVMSELTFSSRDEFTREPIAEKIIKLLDSDIEVSPLIIDGQWGTGKTEFCFKLKNLIEANNTNDYKVGYVNAFQADHANEPLLTLIAEVASFYDEKDEKRKNFIKNAVPYLRLISGIGLKAGLGFAFGRYAADIPDALADGMEEIKDGSKSLIDQSLESMIKDQVEAEKNLSTLRDALSDIASTNPIILLIDELDRCRPDFAVMMLETIKHVFDVGNVQIILITNAEQLKATIKHSYGSETNSHDYLYKFFKYQINLPTSTQDIEGKSVENNIAYFRTVVQNSKVIPQNFKDNELIYDISKFVNISRLSLRKVEQVIRCIETLVIFEDKEKSKYIFSEQILTTFLCFIYIIDYKIFMDLVKRRLTYENLRNCIKDEIPNLVYDRDIIENNGAIFSVIAMIDSLVINNIIKTDYANRLSNLRLLIEVLNNKLHIQGLSIQDNTIRPNYHLSVYIVHTTRNLLLFDAYN